ncbi:MAG: MarR family transcriptional regulator [Bacteroidetes bacterium]|nr:MarR family transcriptional regulator [Bacteroidota bacterium]
MKLEDEIKQSKFRNEYHKLAVNILYTHGWLIAHQSKLFQEYDITSQQYNILRILRGQYPNPATIALLRERMLDKMSDTSRLVERLKDKGLIERKICDEDRRRVDVIITNNGLSLLDKMDEVVGEFEKLFTNLTKSEAKTLNSLLDKMRD